MSSPARRPAASSGTPRTTPARGRTPRTGAVRTRGGRDLRPAAATGAAGRATRSTPTRPDLWLVPAGEAARRARPAPRRRAPFVLLLVALLLATTLGLLFLNTAIAVDSLRATQLRTENAQRQEEIQRLQRQVVQGGTPAELAREAAEAGLVPAGPPAYLVLEPDGGSTVRGAPQPAAEDGTEDGAEDGTEDDAETDGGTEDPGVD
ncbi:hypothetical protein [Geodermatophilus sp. SYSU D00815]